MPRTLHTSLPPPRATFCLLWRAPQWRYLTNQGTSRTGNIVIAQSTQYRTHSAPTSPLYITKLLEDVVDDYESACYAKLSVTSRMLPILCCLQLREKNTSRGGKELPIEGLMGMCRWMGSHFHYWNHYNGVAFSSIFYKLTRIGSHFYGILSWDF